MVPVEIVNLLPGDRGAAGRFAANAREHGFRIIDIRIYETGHTSLKAMGHGNFDAWLAYADELGLEISSHRRELGPPPSRMEPAPSYGGRMLAEYR